eukprot:TRINITY_DN7234_c0_g1_i1.p1 TRINITY_DN7234_c0_g1~~TRINITY_DN7234_c0_g1_i1.p1  ORF type:complete len:418 (+),score=29.75 TRINITY_DN7234_c0_g1_i1:173-1426(+)
MSFFMNDSLRNDLHKRTSLILQGSNPDDPVSKTLPVYVHNYHSLWPLEPSRDMISQVYNLPTTVYKAINRNDGLPYTIRKINNFRLTANPAQSIETWKQIRHPNIITLKEVFVSQQFDNINCIFFVYDYHPGAETIEQKYLQNDDLRVIPEDTLWSFAIQLCSAFRTIHAYGLSCKNLSPSKILETGKNRIRINCLGIEDVLKADVGLSNESQREDILHLGRFLLILACKSMKATNNVSRSLEYIGRCYSSDFKELVISLLGNKDSLSLTLDDVWRLLGPKLNVQIDSLYSYSDMLESELAKELENGRLFRLLAKLGFINERPEYDISSSWSETGDRYLLKLFRDYTFHQVYEDGNPVIDFAHVVECLNKLDVGTDEKVLLTSRDEKSMLVLSYRDLKRCLNDAFYELLQKSRTVMY